MIQDISDIKRAFWCAARVNVDLICIDTFSGFRGGTDRDYKGAQYLLKSGASFFEQGQAILGALAKSRFVLPAPREGFVFPDDVEFDPDIYRYELSNERHAAWVNTLMTAYGYKTKRALFKNLKSCGIELRDGFITIRPSHHEKLEVWTGKGIEKTDWVTIPADVTPDKIGEALQLALSRCT